MAGMRRSTQMLALGIAVFIVGAGVVILSLGGSGGDGSATATTTTTIVQGGTVVVPSGAAPVPTSFTIPEGKQAVAVQMPYVQGLAGYAKAGDLVNVYATIEKGQVRPELPPPVAKLVLPAVEVLAVSGAGPGTETGTETYLLALDAAQAEQMIFFARFESVWLTLAPKGQPAPTTPGISHQNAF
ncbi:MAG: RcpC/CpaB family pilus assembly protein [Acidimicrobiia bacterium]